MPARKEEIAISIVVPIWNEAEEIIKELYSRLTRILSEINRSYEIIFVDNASDGEVFNILHGLYRDDSKIKIIRLCKNFGQSAAFLAGFDYARGETIVTLDSDLQYFPEDLPRFIEKIDAGSDAVSGRRVKRCDPFFTRIIPSYFMNKIMTLKTGVGLHDWGSSYCALKKNIAGRLRAYGANARFIKPLVANMSGIIEIKIRHHHKNRRPSKYNVFNLTFIAWDFFTNYSFRPKGKYDSLFIVKEVY